MPIRSEDGAGGTAQAIVFVAADWAAGVVDQITVVGQGVVPAAGQVGPHRFANNMLYAVQVYQDLGGNLFDQVDVTVQINLVTGAVQLDKAAAVADFDGRVIIGGTQ